MCRSSLPPSCLLLFFDGPDAGSDLFFTVAPAEGIIVFGNRFQQFPETQRPFSPYRPAGAGSRSIQEFSSRFLVFSIPVMLLTTIKFSDLCHLIVSQFKTEQVEVFPYMIGIARTGDHDDASL